MDFWVAAVAKSRNLFLRPGNKSFLLWVDESGRHFSAKTEKSRPLNF